MGLFSKQAAIVVGRLMYQWPLKSTGI